MTESDRKLGIEICKRFPVDLADVQGIIDMVRKASLKCEWQEDFDCHDSCCIEDVRCNHPEHGPLGSSSAASSATKEKS